MRRLFSLKYSQSATVCIFKRTLLPWRMRQFLETKLKKFSLPS